MSILKSTITLALLLTVSGVWAQGNALWMRYPAISPDGKTIAFNYKGDIYTVSSEGGRATQLTTHPAYDGQAVLLSLPTVKEVWMCTLSMLREVHRSV